MLYISFYQLYNCELLCFSSGLRPLMAKRPAAHSLKQIVDMSNSASLRYEARQDPGVASSIVSDREFDFNDELVDSRVYRKAIATATTAASSPKPAPEYKVFLVPSDFCFDKQASEPRCMSVENLNIMASGGWGGIRDRCPTNASGIQSLGSRITEVLCSRPHKSWETTWRLYMYCAPCRWQNEIALSIAGHVADFNGFIRVDDRLNNACPPLLDTVPSMRNMEDMLTTVEHEWRIENIFTRSWLSSLFDLSWLQRRNLVLESATETEDLTLQMYLDQAEQDERVAAIVILSSVADIERLVNRHPVSATTSIRDSVVYQLKFDGKRNIWTADIFSRL